MAEVACHSCAGSGRSLVYEVRVTPEGTEMHACDGPCATCNGSGRVQG